MRLSSVCEDQRGNLWIGTLGAGLLRHDGYSFHSYRKEDGLINNFVHAVYEDDAGKLWIGTEEGVSIYDGVRFSHFKELREKTINSILQDRFRRLWFATRNDGLYMFNGAVLRQFTVKDGLTDNAINCLYQDKDSLLWIGTKKGLVKFDGQTFKSYTKANGLISNDVRGVCKDDKGIVWLALDRGVSQFNGNDFINYSVKNGLNSNEVNAVLTDEKNNIWFGTSVGITKYDGNKFQHYDAGIGQGTNATTSIYKDSAGTLWFSTARGLSKFVSERFVHYRENDQMGTRIFSVIQAINGNIICGTSLGGTTVFDGKNYALVNETNGFTSSVVQSFYYTPDSVLWIGTQDDGAYKFNKSQFQKFTTDEGLASNNITGFAIDVIGDLWVASADSGVSVLQAPYDSIGTVKRYSTANGLASNKISTIKPDKNGNLWISTEDNGLNKVTVSKTSPPVIKHYSTKDGLVSNTIHALIIDSLNQIYIGTSRGISVFDGKQFYNISKAEGLSSNNIYSLTFDNEKNLWVGTERGVDKVSFGKNFSIVSINHYGSDEGFKGLEVYRNSSLKDKAGNLWFGTVNGLVKYNPQEEVLKKITPRTYITGIKLFFDKIEDTGYADSVSAWYPIPAGLILPYNQNNLTFSFVGIFHPNPQAVRYKWVLEGSTNDWSPPLNEREATFSNLPPGDYNFKVIACNEDNVWNETPASFQFTILPPLWDRWWVRVVGAGTLLFLISMIVVQRFKRIKAKNKRIQEKLEMEKNIIQLEQEAARLQMNPHFIFNSLNSIQGFIASNDPFQAKRYLAKFAHLMRLILENAREEFIPLKNETDILENYLELEKLSTNNKFDFTINIAESIDPENIEIPPMMIQPFVENAIIHGVKKKEGKGFIAINFSVAGDLVICEIVDNGIGRMKSAQINGQSRPKHKSTGISVTTKRLEQLAIQKGLKAGIEIVDMEEEGRPVGTKVIISIPFEAF